MQSVNTQENQGRKKAGHEIRSYLRPVRGMEHGLLYECSTHPRTTENPQPFSATSVLTRQRDGKRPSDMSRGVGYGLFLVSGERRYIQEGSWSANLERDGQ